MSTSFKSTGKLLAKTFEKAFEAQIKKALQEEAGDAIIEIQTRSQSGQSFEGGAFVEYGESYKKRKGEGTIFLRKKKSGGSTKASIKKAGNQSSRSTTPDLTLTGSMWRALTSKFEKISNGFRLSIFFVGAKQAAKAQGNQRVRKFFGFSKTQEKEIINRIESQLNLKEANK